MTCLMAEHKENLCKALEFMRDKKVNRVFRGTFKNPYGLDGKVKKLMTINSDNLGTKKFYGGSETYATEGYGKLEVSEEIN